MTNKELQALRRALFISTKEAAEHIGKVSVRGWQHWEKGTYAIPDDVSIQILNLSEKRMNMIEACEEIIHEKDADEVYVDYHMNFDDYLKKHPGDTLIDFRLTQSVAACLFAEKVLCLK